LGIGKELKNVTPLILSRLFLQLDTEAKRAKRGSVQSTRKSTSINSESSVKSEPSAAAAVVPSANSSVPSAVTQSSPKQELVSRSGRKIKPKKFLDEETFEGGPGGGPEVNGMCCI
jgi:hypothetical protein